MGITTLDISDYTKLVGITGTQLSILRICTIDLVIGGSTFPTKFHVLSELTDPPRLVGISSMRKSLSALDLRNQLASYRQRANTEVTAANKE